MKNKNKQKGFSLMELIVVVAIIGVLSGTAYLGVRSVQRDMMNHKMLDDLIVIANGTDQYRRDHGGKYPIPEAGKNMNVNCYYADATYAHDCENASFVQGMIDNTLLGKKYLQEVPTDPRTGSRYVYGVSTDGKYFQVAGVWDKGGSYEARTTENVHKGFHLPSLIRSFDGPNFVINKGEYLPYNPDNLTLIARLHNVQEVTLEKADGSSAPANNGDMAGKGDTITTGDSGYADLYFADGTVSHLDGDSELRLDQMSVPENNNKNLITKIKVFLSKGNIWNKVVRLAEKSEFNIETASAVAGVRGTEFKVDDTGMFTVRSGRVVVKHKASGQEKDINNGVDEQGNPIEITPEKPKSAVITGDNIAIAVSNKEQVQQDYEAAFVRKLDNTISPKVLGTEMDGDDLYIKLSLIDLPFETIGLEKEIKAGEWADIGTVNYTEPSDYYRIMHTEMMSDSMIRFYFDDSDENRSGYSIPLTLNATVGETNFSGIHGDEKVDGNWQWEPQRIILSGSSQTVQVRMNLKNAEEVLGEREGDITYEATLGMNTNVCAADEGVQVIIHNTGNCYLTLKAMLDGEPIAEKDVVLIVKPPSSVSAEFTVGTDKDCSSSNNFTVFAGYPLTLHLCPMLSADEEGFSIASGNGEISEQEYEGKIRSMLTVQNYGNVSVTLNVRDIATGDTDMVTNEVAINAPVLSEITITHNAVSTVSPGTNLELTAMITMPADTPDELKNISDNCQWQGNGNPLDYANGAIMIPADATGEFNITCNLETVFGFEIADSLTGNSLLLALESGVEGLCTGEGTSYDGTACWILAESSTENCLDVCGGKELSCSTDTNWIVTQEVCGELQDGASLSTETHISDYSPIFISGICKNDDDNIRACNESGFGPYNRICKCQ